MYELIYKYGDNFKRAYVVTLSAEDARTILLEHFMVDAITILSAIQVSPGSVIYPDGRF